MDIGSDKLYYHRYGDFYQRYFPEPERTHNILEMGIFEGESIRWLLNEYPKAHIYGIDILGPLEIWPRDVRVGYLQADQSSPEQLSAVLSNIDRQFDLVIEDGSHEPPHQRNSLIAVAPWMAPGGTYVVEDIHTSYRQLVREGLVGSSPDSPGVWTLRLQRIMTRIPRLSALTNHQASSSVNLLNVLLGIERARVLERGLSEAEVSALSSTGFISYDQIQDLDAEIDRVHLYHRPVLPERCWRCKGLEFNLASLTCLCGTPIYAFDDSMTAVVTFC